MNNIREGCGASNLIDLTSTAVDSQIHFWEVDKQTLMKVIAVLNTWSQLPRNMNVSSVLAIMDIDKDALPHEQTERGPAHF